MRVMIDDNKKIIIFWNPKCACSYLKSIFLKSRNEFPGRIEDTHSIIGYGWPENPYSYLDPNKFEQYAKYKKVLFVRDPYKRLVSGFLEKIPKWIKNGDLKSDYCHNFRHFLEKIKIDDYKIYNDGKIVDESHFLPQFSQDFSKVVENGWEFDGVYDISDIRKLKPVFTDLFGKEVDDYETVGLGKAHSTKYSPIVVSGAEHVPIDIWLRSSKFPNYKSFYTDHETKAKVNELYSVDFENLKKLGINYTL